MVVLALAASRAIPLVLGNARVQHHTAPDPVRPFPISPTVPSPQVGKEILILLGTRARRPVYRWHLGEWSVILGVEAAVLRWLGLSGRGEWQVGMCLDIDTEEDIAPRAALKRAPPSLIVGPVLPIAGPPFVGVWGRNHRSGLKTAIW